MTHTSNFDRELVELVPLGMHEMPHEHYNSTGETVRAHG